MKDPLVSIICFCYNQEDFIFEALNSVQKQTYSNLELIIVDNASGDNSVEKINAWLRLNDVENQLPVFFHKVKLNYCKAFNKALKHARGEYIIDLSGDDWLFPEHVERSVNALKGQQLAAVCSSNAYLAKEGNEQMDTFFPMEEKGKAAGLLPSGDIYERVIRRYCVCTPTMVFNAKILKKEGGYNEQLIYEDFDVVTRLARKYHFVYSGHIGVKKNIHKSAFSAQQYKKRQSEMLWSTLTVCENIARMNCSLMEDRALVIRCIHEAKHSLASANFEVAQKFLELAEKTGAKGPRLWLFKMWSKLRPDLSFLYEWLKSN